MARRQINLLTMLLKLRGLFSKHRLNKQPFYAGTKLPVYEDLFYIMTYIMTYSDINTFKVKKLKVLILHL